MKKSKISETQKDLSFYELINFMFSVFEEKVVYDFLEECGYDEELNDKLIKNPSPEYEFLLLKNLVREIRRCFFERERKICNDINLQIINCAKKFNNKFKIKGLHRIKLSSFELVPELFDSLSRDYIPAHEMRQLDDQWKREILGDRFDLGDPENGTS